MLLHEGDFAFLRLDLADTVCLAGHNAERFHLRSQQALENTQPAQATTCSERCSLCQIAGRLAVTQRDSLVRFAGSPLPHPSGQGREASPGASVSQGGASAEAK